MIRVYEYGCLEPIENLDWAREQLKKAYEYRTALAALEIERRIAALEEATQQENKPA